MVANHGTNISYVAGSFANFYYFVIDSPVIGWMTGEQKFSIGAIVKYVGIENIGWMTEE